MVTGLKACLVTDNLIIFIFMSEAKGGKKPNKGRVYGRLPHRKPLLSERRRDPFRQPARKHDENNVLSRDDTHVELPVYRKSIHSIET